MYGSNVKSFHAAIAAPNVITPTVLRMARVGVLPSRKYSSTITNRIVNRLSVVNIGRLILPSDTKEMTTYAIKTKLNGATCKSVLKFRFGYCSCGDPEYFKASHPTMVTTPCNKVKVIAEGKPAEKTALLNRVIATLKTEYVMAQNMPPPERAAGAFKRTDILS